MLCGEIFASESALRNGGSLQSHRAVVERAFVIIGLHRNPPEWRYRLGVRTEDSQSYSGQPKYMVALIFVCFTFVGIGRLLWQWVKFG